MAHDHERHEKIAIAARELARSGRCKNLTEIEVGLILRDFGEAHEKLSDPILRAELEMLCEESVGTLKSHSMLGVTPSLRDRK